MRDEDIHIGDVLYIREWDDMLRDGKLDAEGNIVIVDSNRKMEILFREKLKHKCGEQFTVKDVHLRPSGLLYESEEDSKKGAFAVWLTPNPPHFETATDDEIKLLLSYIGEELCH